MSDPPDYVDLHLYVWPIEMDDAAAVVQRDLYSYLDEEVYKTTSAGPIVRVGGGDHLELQPTGEVPFDVIGVPTSYLRDIGIEAPPQRVSVSFATPTHAHHIRRGSSGDQPFYENDARA